MNGKARRLLYRSLETTLSSPDARILEEALASSEELRRERDVLVRVRSEAPIARAESFGPFFADRVMANVTAEAREARSLFGDLVAVFKPVAFAAGLALALLAPLGARPLYESLTQPKQPLVSMAESAYALEVEDMLWETE
jgi:hypothetical protein